MKTIVNHLGQTCEKAVLDAGYYRSNDGHVYHVQSTGITHVNPDQPLINKLNEIRISDSETLNSIDKEQFEDAMRNAILNIGIYKYVK
jgi:hypothetical protein